MDSLHYCLMRAHNAVNRTILDEAASLGLTPGQPKILEFLTNYGECDQKTLAAECEIEQATAGGILLRMEEAGLIVRRRREGNRRSLYVLLSPKGEEAARRMAEVFARADARAASLLSGEEEKTLKNLLAAVRRAMIETEEK